MAGIMEAPNFVTLLAYDPTTHMYIPVQAGPMQVDPINQAEYAVLQTPVATGAGSTDITIHDFTTVANHLKVNADGSINVNASGAASTTAINDGSLTNQKLAVDATGKIGINNYPTTQPVSGTVSVNSIPSLPAGTAVIGHVIVDSAGSVVISSLPSLPAGTAVIGHVIVDSAAGVVISSLPSLPAGNNAIGSVSVSNFPATQPISGSVSVSNFPLTQPISASSLPLPTGAATEAGHLATLDTKTPVLGQTTMANSRPVAIASDQSILPINLAAQSGIKAVTNADNDPITANTDYTITFPSQISHFALENNSTATIQWELDAITKSSSLHLPNAAPGNLLLMDVKCTTIHILSPGATNLNAATGICIRGWA